MPICQQLDKMLRTCFWQRDCTWMAQSGPSRGTVETEMTANISSKACAKVLQNLVLCMAWSADGTKWSQLHLTKSPQTCAFMQPLRASTGIRPGSMSMFTTQASRFQKLQSLLPVNSRIMRHKNKCQVLSIAALSGVSACHTVPSICLSLIDSVHFRSLLCGIQPATMPGLPNALINLHHRHCDQALADAEVV